MVAVYPNYVHTVEGNTGDGEVAERDRYYSSIICGVRPFYDSNSSGSSSNNNSNSNSGSSLVKEAQRFLVTQGFSVGSSGIDGDYGPCTNAGLVKFVQAQLNSYGAGLAVDGSRGPLTQAA